MYKKIIPCLDVFKGKLVKGVKFQNLKVIGNPVEYAKKYCEQGADELVFLDIGATPENRDIMLDLVKKVSEQVTVPFIVGGGIRNLDDIRKVLEAGADKISINTAAVKNPQILKDASEEFGSESIILAIDAKKMNNTWKVLINGGKKVVDLDVFEWAKKAEKLGVGELLPTSWDADGTKKGYDIELCKRLAETVSIPITASGGAGLLEDIFRVLTEGKTDNALIAGLLHYGDYTVKDVKKFLSERGVKVKL